MKYSRPSMIRRLRILEHSDSSGSLKATARIFKVQTSQIRRWRKNRAEIEKVVRENPKARTLCTGPSAQNEDLEKSLCEWITGRRDADHPVSTNQIIAKARSMQVNFKDGDMKKLIHWVYEFMRRYNLVLRMSTHVGQKTSGQSEAVKKNFSRHVMSKFQNKVGHKNFFVNMD